MMKIAVLLLIALAILFSLPDARSGWANVENVGELAYIVVGLALIGLYVASLRLEYNGRLGHALRHATIWLGLGFALVTGYAYRGELSEVAARVRGEMAPPGTPLPAYDTESGERAVRLRMQPNGSFMARGAVNSVITRFIVDTGATTVVLKATDAAMVGIDVDNLSFSVPVETANGTTFTAPVRLKSVTVGPLELTDVEALVAKPGNLKENLLGMSFLKRLRSYEVSGNFLTLRN